MKVILRWNIVRIVLTTLYLLCGWLLFTGTLAPFPLILGFLYSFLIALLTYRFFIEEQEAGRRALFPRIYLLAVYLAVIALNVYMASFKIALKVITFHINPRIVHFRTRLRSDTARVVLANSITLTPGTLTLNLEDDHLIVHWLDARTTHSGYASRLIARPFEGWLRRIWG